MKNPKEFEAEFEALLIKHEVAQCVSIFPMEGLTRTLAYAAKKEEEVEISQTFDKLGQLVGGFNVTNANKLIEFLERYTDLAIGKGEEVISQVTWEKMAYDNAERLLSEDDYERLEETITLKNAAVRANEWERAAIHREEELRLLSKVMDDINKFD
jgi:hypothetical protein